ncbi:YraN family protein [Thioclava kandeliae]|uniref:YraN family protein n=1 Tax=Thioclava kandeliae TaxID=3070818 RepID=A0ABV1SE18_9RHOB
MSQAPGDTPEDRRRHARGLRAHLSGEVAEAQVARHYEALGFVCRETRWRGPYGEIDLIMEGSCLAFVEVKRARTFAQAAPRLAPAQVARIGRAALDYIARHPDLRLKPMRFDLALVDGKGEIRLIPDAFRFDQGV